MGSVRLLLALSVVIFHVSGYMGNVGYAAVLAFLIISGYSNACSLNRNGYTILRFYGGRIRRLYVPYFLCVLLVGLLYRLFYDVIPGAFPVMASPFKIIDYLREFFYNYRLYPDNKWLMFTAFPRLVPQNWTDSIFLFMYLIAPGIIWISNRSKKMYYAMGVISLAPIAYTMIKGYDFPTYRYRSVFCLVFYFWLGTALNEIKDILRIKRHSKVVLLFIEILFVSYFIFTKNTPIELDVVLSFLIIIPMILYSTEIERTKTDILMSRLSAYVYLMHFLGIAILRIVAHYCGLSVEHQWMDVIAVIMITMGIAFVCVQIESGVKNFVQLREKRRCI